MRLLSIFLNGDALAEINAGDQPCEITPSKFVGPGATIEFEDGLGQRHVHSLAELSGWAHFSIRVHQGLACQADCVVTENETFEPGAHLDGTALGIRFQPFFLPGSTGDPLALRGQGLFQRGMHFSGSVTPGSVRLSCECDYCAQSFQVQSFHAGFSNAGYMYSASGAYTLFIPDHVPGAPPALGRADLEALRTLEGCLPPAPDGTRFGYWNPFRCPHCAQPYIDFEAHPELRESEYYGNCFYGAEPIRYERQADIGKKSPLGFVQRLFGR